MKYTHYLHLSQYFLLSYLCICYNQSGDSMTKILFNNEEIEVVDSLEDGEEEFDLVNPDLNKKLILKKENVNNEQRPSDK